MDFDWIIVSRFAICLNFLFLTYKYYDRTFLNFDLCTFNFGLLSDFRFPIFRILVHLFDCRLVWTRRFVILTIGKGSSHMEFDLMIVSRLAICLNFLFLTYKYYDRTFMNLDFHTINSEIFSISEIPNQNRKIGESKIGNSGNYLNKNLSLIFSISETGVPTWILTEWLFLDLRFV